MEEKKNPLSEKYAEYIKLHIKEITQQVTDAFEAQKEFLKASVLTYVKNHYLTPLPPHRVLVDDGCPYDYSGELEEQGVISLNQTLSEFLENEYTGNKEATYESHMGWRWFNYSEELGSDLTLPIGYNLMLTTIKKSVEDHFQCSVSIEEIQDIAFDYVFDFDEIYGNSPTFQFFTGSMAVDFLGIGNIPLSEIVR